jgi:glucosamine-6-phosphate deaminase
VVRPRIVVVDHPDELGRVGADLVAEAIARYPASSVVAATGRTPMGLYAELASRRRTGLIDTDRITVVQLDEYLGLGVDDRRTLRGWMRRSFLEPLEIRDDRVMMLPLDGELAQACTAFDQAIQDRGGLDLAILGLGQNGHLGFNEPPSDHQARTRRVELSPVTIEANARYWGATSDVPREAVTVGLRSLLAARTIVVVVSGESKHAIVREVVDGPVGPMVPASYLQDVDGDVTVVVDRAAWGSG